MYLPLRWQLATALAAQCLALGTAAQPSLHPTTTLVISGKVAKTLNLTVDDLRRYPAHQIEEPPLNGTPQNQATELPRSFTGCVLRDVLAAAKPVESKPRNLRKTYVVATASDGYAVIFSWAELFVPARGESVIVAYERDGEPLSVDEGRIALIAVSGTRPARHVKWLRSVEVRTIDP